MINFSKKFENKFKLWSVKWKLKFGQNHAVLLLNWRKDGRRRVNGLQMCLKLLVVLLSMSTLASASTPTPMSTSTPTLTSSGNGYSPHHNHNHHTTRTQEQLLPRNEDIIFQRNVPPKPTNFSLTLQNPSTSTNKTFYSITKSKSKSKYSSLIPKKVQKVASRKKNDKTKVHHDKTVSKTEEELDKASVPVVPIQLPPPNASLQYHYTDDETSSTKYLMKTDFSRIILPFKTTREDVENPEHYREYGAESPKHVFFQDFKSEEMNNDANFNDNFNLFTQFGDEDLKSAGSSTIQQYRQNFEQAFDSDMATFTNPRQNVSLHVKKRKMNKAKRPQEDEEFRQQNDNFSFLLDHDYTQISHDSSAFGQSSGSGTTPSSGSNRHKELMKNQHNDYYELHNKNKNKSGGDSGSSGKSDSLLKSEKKKQKHFSKNATSADSLSDSDELEGDYDSERYFESKKILQKDTSSSKNSNVSSNHKSTNSIPGSSLEDVSLSLNFDNGGDGSSGKSLMRRRPRRSVVHLYDMVVCATGCNPLAYKGYGCYCGFLGSGLTVDGIDRCCAKHDWCYHHAKCPPFLTYFVPYYWTCNDGRPRCVTEYRGWKGVCGANLCECDRQFAECLRKFPCPRSRAMCMTSPWRNLPIGPNFVFLA